MRRSLQELSSFRLPRSRSRYTAAALSLTYPATLRSRYMRILCTASGVGNQRRRSPIANMMDPEQEGIIHRALLRRGRVAVLRRRRAIAELLR